MASYISHGPNSIKSVSNSSSSFNKSKKSSLLSSDSTLMDEAAIRTVISILTGYIGRYLRDSPFRKTIRQKCNSFLDRTRTRDEFLLLQNMDEVDRLVEEEEEEESHGNKNKLKNSIEILSIIASSLSANKKSSNLCACANLYLAISYKLLKNPRASSKHLLQVFIDSPSMARTYLLPQLWDHLFLPHLLHLKIWYEQDLGDERNKKMKVLGKVYNEKMDGGTCLFAMYYKQWLKVGATTDPPPLPPPLVSLPPSMPMPRRRRRMSSDSSFSNFSINPSLYKAVFGTKLEPIISKVTEIDEKLYGDEFDKCSSVQKEENIYPGRSSFQIDRNDAQFRAESQRLDYFQCFSCRNITAEGNGNINHRSVRKETTSLPSDLVEAITTMCSSDILTECESAIRVVTGAWLRSPGDPLIEEALSQPSVMEAILEVLFASTEDEILELIISILAELVSKNDDDSVRQIILNSDPQLETFVRLLRSTSLFLKAAVLLYLSKPLAKQMLSSEWVPLVLRVLEFGNKSQTLFTVQCSPQVAAFYFLDQLLTGFDEDKNLENARQVLSLGGLTLLIRRIEGGDFRDRNKAALIISCCIRAEGSCRSFLAENVNKSSLLELIVLGNKESSRGCAFSVLAELLYLDRRVKILNFLRGLKDGWGGINTMHILYIYLQKAPPEECPLVAVMLLLLDLMLCCRKILSEAAYTEQKRLRHS